MSTEHSGPRTPESYPERFRQVENPKDDPRLATANLKIDISKISTPNIYARDRIGYTKFHGINVASTRRCETYTLREFIHFINGARDKPLDDVSINDVNVYVSYCKDELLNTQQTIRIKLYKLVNLYEHIYTNCNPPEQFELTPIEIDAIDLDSWSDYAEGFDREPISRDEVARMFEVMAGKMPYRNRVVVRILYFTGIRNSDLRNLKIRDVNLEDNKIVIRDSKFGQSYDVPITGDLEFDLRNWIHTHRPKVLNGRESEYLIPSQRSDHVESNAGLIHIVDSVAKAAGIDETIGTTTNKGKVCEMKKVTPHTLRHSISTHLDEVIEKMNEDDELIQGLLGHEDEDSKSVYIHNDSEDEFMNRLVNMIEMI